MSITVIKPEFTAIQFQNPELLIDEDKNISMIYRINKRFVIVFDERFAKVLSFGDNNQNCDQGLNKIFSKTIDNYL